MIAYADLAAALDRWRARNGLPITSSAPPAPVANVAAVLPPSRPAPAPAPVAAPTPPPPARTAPPSPPPAAAAVVVDDEVDADMLEAADEYDNEGQDFAMSFGGPPAAASGSIGGTIGDEEVEESTHIGAAVGGDEAFGAAPTTAVPPPSQWPEAKEWPAEATSAAAYGWGQGHRPDAGGGEDDSTIVGGGKKR